MTIDYDRLRELAEEATPGPWERHPEMPRALVNLETRFMVHHEMVKNRGMEPSAEDAANTELIALAPDMARELPRLHDGIEVIRDYCAGVAKNARAAGVHTVANEMYAIAKALTDLLEGDTE